MIDPVQVAIAVVAMVVVYIVSLLLTIRFLNAKGRKWLGIGTPLYLCPVFGLMIAVMIPPRPMRRAVGHRTPRDPSEVILVWGKAPDQARRMGDIEVEVCVPIEVESPGIDYFADPIGVKAVELGANAVAEIQVTLEETKQFSLKPRRLFTARGVAIQLEPQDQETALSHGVAGRALASLPCTSGCPCCHCGKTGRALRFRRLQLGVGYLYWQRLTTWHGYTCGWCAMGLSVVSLLAGVGSCLLIHPQGLLWGPITFVRNLWSTCFGTAPGSNLTFFAGDLDNGTIRAGAAARAAAAATEILNTDPGSKAGLYVGVVAVACGFDDRAFIRRLSDALASHRDRGWARRWARVLERSAPTGLPGR